MKEKGENGKRTRLLFAPRGNDDKKNVQSGLLEAERLAQGLGMPVQGPGAGAGARGHAACSPRAPRAAASPWGRVPRPVSHHRTQPRGQHRGTQAVLEAARSRKHQPVKFSAFFGFAASVFRARSLDGRASSWLLADPLPASVGSALPPGLPWGSFHCHRSPIYMDITAAPKPCAGQSQRPPLNGFGGGTAPCGSWGGLQAPEPPLSTLRAGTQRNSLVQIKPS